MNDTLPPPNTATYVPPAQQTTQPTDQPSGQQAQQPRADRIVRPRNGRRIGGVCAGIANRYGWDPSAVRIVTVLSVFLPGPQVLAYLAAWLVLPNEDDVQ